MPCFKIISKVQADEGDTEYNAKVNIRWILFKLRKAVNVEVAKAPTSMNIVSFNVIFYYNFFISYILYPGISTTQHAMPSD